MDETTRSNLPHHRLHAYGRRAGTSWSPSSRRASGTRACAAVEIAAACGDASPGAAAEVERLAARLYAMLTPLARAR